MGVGYRTRAGRCTVRTGQQRKVGATRPWQELHVYAGSCTSVPVLHSWCGVPGTVCVSPGMAWPSGKTTVPWENSHQTGCVCVSVHPHTAPTKTWRGRVSAPYYQDGNRARLALWAPRHGWVLVPAWGSCPMASPRPRCKDTGSWQARGGGSGEADTTPTPPLRALLRVARWQHGPVAWRGGGTATAVPVPASGQGQSPLGAGQDTPPSPFPCSRCHHSPPQGCWWCWGV